LAFSVPVSACAPVEKQRVIIKDNAPHETFAPNEGPLLRLVIVRKFSVPIELRAQPRASISTGSVS
jgi:hypothetical protein